MRTARGLVDFALRRRSVLAEVTAGRVPLEDVCDAGTYLLQAAAFHGVPSDQVCPMCRKEPLTHVHWVYGEELDGAAGSARSPEELARMEENFHEFDVHVVEVCRTCRWNHLVLSFVLGHGQGRRPGRRRVAKN